MRRKRQSQQRILFPWDVRVGVLRWLLLGRVRSILSVGAIAAFVSLIAVREREQSGRRQTRAAIYDMRRAIDSYMAEHEGACPPNLESVAPLMKGVGVRKDAWQRPFELLCPGRRSGLAYELMSDGPDGLPGGLDRIE
jgi:general secretion pathway protein G